MILPRLALLSSLSLLFACAEEVVPPPLTEVIVDSVISSTHRPSGELVGRLHAFDDVSIKANVSGYLLERSFREGDWIKKGAILYKIDPATFEADRAAAKAELSRMQAAQKVAGLNYDRGLELQPQGYISASEMDTLNSNKLQADANLQGALAKLERANVNLSYTVIEAPISGQIGRSEVSVGDLIGQDSGALTTLVDVDPIKVIFQASEAAYLGTQKKRKVLEQHGLSIPDLTVSLEMSNGEVYEHQGKIDFVANRIDEATGTIETRALVPNPKGLLKPGQYVKVLLELTESIDVLLLPQAAIQADQQGEFALVVSSDGKVGRRNVVLGDRVGENVIVKDGLKEGEHVIVRGLQQVRPGQEVRSKHIDSADASKLNSNPAPAAQ